MASTPLPDAETSRPASRRREARGSSRPREGLGLLFLLAIVVVASCGGLGFYLVRQRDLARAREALQSVSTDLDPATPFAQWPEPDQIRVRGVVAGGEANLAGLWERYPDAESAERLAILQALGQIGTPATRVILARVARSLRPDEAEMAMVCLAHNGAPAVPVIASLATGDSRSAAIAILGARSVPPAQRQDAAASLRPLQDSDDPEVLRALIQALPPVPLSELGGFLFESVLSIHPEVSDAATDDLLTLERREQLYSLADGGARIRYVRAGMSRPYDHVRLNVRRFLGGIRGPEVLAIAREDLVCDDPMLVAAAARTLANERETDALGDMLIAAGRCSEESARAVGFGVATLGRGQPSRVLADTRKRLREMLGSTSPPTRAAAMLALGRLRDGVSVEAMWESFNSGDAYLAPVAHDALVAYAGNDPGPDPEAWQSWWKGERRKIDLDVEANALLEKAKQIIRDNETSRFEEGYELAAHIVEVLEQLSSLTGRSDSERMEQAMLLKEHFLKNAVIQVGDDDDH